MFHMLTDIMNFGPCFTHNCFTYESMNGILLSFINGKQANISSALHAIQLMQMLQEISIEGAHEDVKTTFNLLNKENITGDQAKNNKRTLFDNCFSVGTIAEQQLSAEIELKIRKLFPNLIQQPTYQSFSQIKLNNIQYYAAKVNKTKTNNSGCNFKTNNLQQFGIIESFIEIRVQTEKDRKSEFVAIINKPKSKSPVDFEHYQLFYKNSNSLIIIQIVQICERVMIIDVDGTFIWTVSIPRKISQ